MRAPTQSYVEARVLFSLLQETTDTSQSQTFRNPKGDLLERLKESGPAGETNGAPAAAAAKPEKKRQKATRNVDMEKLAEALPQLQEDDLLQVVQMVHDNKSEETYTKNDVESEYTIQADSFHFSLSADL